MPVDQGSAAYGTRATLSTASNFQLQAEAPSFTYHLRCDSQVLLTLTCTKILM